MKILYIEDSHELAIVVLDFLKKDGHEIHWIDDREKLPNDLESFDFVLSDFQVPGGEFVQTQELCEKFHKPLLLVSGNHFQKPPHKHFLSKPFNYEQLTNEISKTLQGGNV